MRYRRKTDRNQREIVDALRRCGRSVFDASGVGGGFPDLVVGFQGLNYLLEIKMEDGELQPIQSQFFDSWRGQKAVVRTVDEALEATSGKVKQSLTKIRKVA